MIKYMKKIQATIENNSVKLSQEQVIQISSLAKQIVTVHTDISKTYKRTFAMSIVEMLKERQGQVI